MVIIGQTMEQVELITLIITGGLALAILVLMAIVGGVGLIAIDHRFGLGLFDLTEEPSPSRKRRA